MDEEDTKGTFGKPPRNWNGIPRFVDNSDGVKVKKHIFPKSTPRSFFESLASAWPLRVRPPGIFG